MPQSHLRAVLSALFVTFLWSTSWVLIKVGLRDLPALTFAGLRYGLAFLCLLPFALRPAPRRAWRALTRRDVAALAGLGLVQYALTQGAQFVGLQRLPATTLSLVLAFTPALVALLGVAFLREPLSRAQWAALFVVLAGAAVYFGPSAPPSGALAVAAVALAANAAQVLLGRGVARAGRVPPLVVTTLGMGVGAAALLGAGVATEGWPTLGPGGWALVAWLAAVNTAFAFTLWNHTHRVLSAVESSLINNTMLVQIALLAAVFLGDALDARRAAGVALVLAGSVAAQGVAAAWARRVRSA